MKGTTNIPGVCVLIRRENKLLFVLRQNTGYKDGEYGLPGGHVEPNETFTQAAVREVMEETGLVIEDSDLQQLLCVQRKSNDSIRLDMYFELRNWKGEPINAEPEVHASISWFDCTELPDNTMDYMKAGLEAIQSGKTYSECNWG